MRRNCGGEKGDGKKGDREAKAFVSLRLDLNSVSTFDLSSIQRHAVRHQLPSNTRLADDRSGPGTPSSVSIDSFDDPYSLIPNEMLSRGIPWRRGGT